MSKKSWLKERLDEGLVFLLEEISKKRSVDFQAVHILTREQSQNTPTPFTFSLLLTSISRPRNLILIFK